MGHSQPVLSKHTPLGWAPRGEACLRMVWEHRFSSAMRHFPLWVPTFLRSPALLPNVSLWPSCSFPSLISLQVSQHYLIFSHWPAFDWDGLLKVFDGFPILLKNKTIKIMWANSVCQALSSCLHSSFCSQPSFGDLSFLPQFFVLVLIVGTAHARRCPAGELCP